MLHNNGINGLSKFLEITPYILCDVVCCQSVILTAAASLREQRTIGALVTIMFRCLRQNPSASFVNVHLREEHIPQRPACQ